MTRAKLQANNAAKRGKMSAMFLPSGLYRRFRNLTESASRNFCTLADLWHMPLTAGGEFHPALKQLSTL